MNVKKSSRQQSTARIWALVLMIVAAGWVGLSYKSTDAFLARQIATDPGAVPNVIMSLSASIIGAVFAGAAAGHLLNVLAIRPLRALPRIVTSSIGGIIAAIATSILGYSAFQATPSVATIISTTAGVAAVIGGCLAARKNTNVVTAGLSATIVLLCFMFLRGWFDSDLMNLLTREPDTYRWIGIVGGLVAGICVGISAYVVLRLRRGNTNLYSHLLAGATPGALWLVSEVGIRIAGAVLMNQAGDVDQLSSLLMQQALDAQLNGCLASLFAGATTAVLAFGLLLPTAKKKAASTPSKTGRTAKPTVEVKSAATDADGATAQQETTTTEAAADADEAASPTDNTADQSTSN